jgi:hypothetical protein
VKNRKMITCPFEDYLQIPAWSYSGIKLNGVDKFEPTEKMKLGTKVHNYLLTPDEYKYDNIETVKPVAIALRKKIPERLWPYLEKEQAVTADFEHEGFCLKYKGRLDLSIQKILVIDIKITSMPIEKVIAYFRYDIQQTGYALGIEAKTALIVSVHPTKLTTQIFNIPIEPCIAWWEKQVKQKGEPIL